MEVCSCAQRSADTRSRNCLTRSNRRISMAKRIGARLAGAKHGDQNPPNTGDLIWLTFTPQSGREQAGRRPALVLSPESYNAKVGLCVVCPVTQHVKGYAFEVPLPDGLPVQGVVLADHIKSADWRA